ncbi:sugar phosphate nucleotidyltransferase [Caldalkalibacillus mannanilyticus]|uniref:sugar phosphate nucleotidyltransferase n=1 Tax=Caldalkalibacillus mannanilyticus TaxID=1418 RepID=UPI0006887E67|nr:sugar phosphate nucleotidyltransferase [Caldalkalibacillus mannanilyticus]
MKEVMGIIHQTKKENLLPELTESRSLGAIPFGGRYRLIDFALSNMVNSGIQNVAIFPQEKYRSMMDHLGSGKEWDLDRKKDGLFILPPLLYLRGRKEMGICIPIISILIILSEARKNMSSWLAVIWCAI